MREQLGRDLDFQDLLAAVDDEAAPEGQGVLVLLQEAEHLVVVVLLHLLDEEVADVGLLVLLAAHQFPEGFVAERDQAELSSWLDVHDCHASRRFVIVQLQVFLKRPFLVVSQHFEFLLVHGVGIGLRVQFQGRTKLKERLLKHDSCLDIP